jgi:large subunit ribosomal protein L9
MRVVFLEDVQGVARGGDVKEVKNGFARNYLIPKKLAVPASHDVLQRVERLKDAAATARLKQLEDIKALGQELDGSRLDIEMRAGSGGRLYGSVTNAIVADSLAQMTGREIDRRTVAIPESIRQVGVYEALVHLHAEVDARLTLVIHAPGMEPDDVVRQAEEAAAAPDGEAPAADDAVEGAAALETEAAEAEAVQDGESASSTDDKDDGGA